MSLTRTTTLRYAAGVATHQKAEQLAGPYLTRAYFEIDDPDGLRRKSCSKEHRPGPIVQMGLLQDRNGLPMTYRLFPGNTVDCPTMIPVLADMKRDFGLERVVAVADKGLNCSDNIAALFARGDGFVFSQSIRGTKSPAELREWAVSEEGYSERGEGFKVKSRQSWKTVTVKAPESDDGREHKARVPVKQVAFWSEKYARLDGYYVIVTSETAMSDDDVIDAFRGLWRIEESFRITKSDLEELQEIDFAITTLP